MTPSWRNIILLCYSKQLPFELTCFLWFGQLECLGPLKPSCLFRFCHYLFVRLFFLLPVTTIATCSSLVFLELALDLVPVEVDAPEL